MQTIEALGRTPASRPLWTLLAALGLAATVLSCASDAKVPTTTPEVPDEPGVILAFSGGGYHALAGGASWMMGLMERRGQYDLGEITPQVRAVGSNSGGSWFMAMAAYSPSFVAELETPGAYRDFGGTDGYMGEVWRYIDAPKDGCAGQAEDEALLCGAVGDVLSTLADGDGFGNFLESGCCQWQGIVDHAVFGQTGFQPSDGGSTPAPSTYWQDLTQYSLNDPAPGWMASKDLVMAGSLLTDEPALTYTRRDAVGLFEHVQTLRGTQPFSTADPLKGEVPIAMAAPGLVDPLPGGDLTLRYGYWDVDRFVPGPSSASAQWTSEQARVSIPRLPVTHAAGISSAAGAGLIDTPILVELTDDHLLPVVGGQVTTALDSFAPAYQLDDPSAPGELVPVIDVHTALVSPGDSAATVSETLADHALVRLADGGWVDNTAVAQMLRYLQDSHGGAIPDGFSIVAFDDYPAAQEHWDSTAADPVNPFPTGTDLANLFGFDACSKGASDTDPNSCQLVDKDDGLRSTGLSPWVFGCDAYFAADPQNPGTCQGPPRGDVLYWQPSDSEGSEGSEGGEAIECSLSQGVVEQPLLYSRFDVTVDFDAPGSKMYGLVEPAGGGAVTGQLHVFAILGLGAAVVPSNEDEYACFDQMVEGIVDNVIRKAATCDPAESSSLDNPCTLGDYLENALGLWGR